MTSFWTANSSSPLTVPFSFGQKGPNVLDLELLGSPNDHDGKDLEIVFSGTSSDVRILPASGRMQAPGSPGLFAFSAPAFSKRFWVELDYPGRKVRLGYDVPIGSSSAIEVPMHLSFPKVFNRFRISNSSGFPEVYFSDAATLSCLGRGVRQPTAAACKGRLEEFGRKYPDHPTIRRLINQPFDQVFNSAAHSGHSAHSAPAHSSHSAHSAPAHSSHSAHSAPAHSTGTSGPVTPPVVTPSGGVSAEDFVTRQGSRPNEVEFSIVIPSGTQARWQFGDRQVGTGASTSHVYSQPGIYTVILTLETPSGSQQAQRRIVVPYEAKAINFHADVTGQEVKFEAVTDLPVSEGFSWEFGDGKTGTGQTVTHTYAQPGHYSVTVSQTRPDGSVKQTKTVSVGTGPAPSPPSPPNPPTPTPGPSPSPGPGPTPVQLSFRTRKTRDPRRLQFTAEGGNNDPDYSWDFGDGNSAAGRVVEHTYAQSGTYSVSLKSSTSAGESRQNIVVPLDAVPVVHPSIQDADQPENVFLLVMLAVLVIFVLLWLITTRNRNR